ncbi:ornithine cyclodeaminase [Streptomyces sp. 5.8]|uniref:ornithine cyclodeaminase n=1 Tax=Streptomyces sp. 5.8 TaxID=3406571 RepID=UPI003BB49C49
MNDTLLYLDAERVAEMLGRFDPLEAVTDAFLAVRAGRAGITPEAALRWTAGDATGARSLTLPAWHERTYGCKVINACIGNPDRGLPRAHGLIILSDPDTAAPVCIMEGARISALRTAAVSLTALRAVRDLADLRHVGLLGAGRQARTHLELLAPRAELQTVTVYDSDPARGGEFAANARKDLPDTEITVAQRAEDAVRGSEVVIAATTTNIGYVPTAWLEAGAVFVNVSLDDATEELLLGCDHLIIDDWTLVAEDTTRLLGRLAHDGRVTAPGHTPPPGGRQVDGEISTLLAGTYPRPIAPTDRIVINPFGMGVHDIALAARVHAAALACGTGTHLPR